MQRWFFKIAYFVLAVIAVVALCKIFAGQVYRRDPSTVDDKNASTINSTSWPAQMRLQMINYVCTTPSPNFDLTEEELIAAWQLPPKTRLSDQMRKIARCRLAAERISPSSDFDPNQCDCVEWWPIGLVVVLILTVCFCSYRFVFGLPMDKSQDKKKLYWISNVSFMFWVAAILSFNFNLRPEESNVGILYTRYGHMNPSYYFLQSADWKLIIFLIKVGFFTSAAEVYYRIWDNEFREWFITKLKKVASSISCKRSVDEKKNNDKPTMIV